MTFPPEPDRWTLEQTNAARVTAIAAFGFSDRQARFLLTVLLHSGVFLERQYCRFGGIVHGQKSTHFLKGLVDRRFATPVTVGKLHRGRMFHVHYKPLWAAIEEPDSRFRKAAAPGRMIERVMVLDGVLDDRSLTWLGTALDKRRHFTRHLGERLKVADLPHLRFGRGAATTTRLFPDKLPIGTDLPSGHHVFIYLVTTPSPWDFRLFLLRHFALLHALGRWTVRLLIPKPMNAARHAYLSAARDHLARPVNPSAIPALEELFRARQRLTTANEVRGDERYRQLSQTFSGPCYGALYRQWLNDPMSAIGMAQSRVVADAVERGEAHVECVELTRQYLHLSPLVNVA
jgi:hypothetical protein